MNRQKGALLLHEGDPRQPRNCISRRWGLAREQEANLWEWRAATSLAGLRYGQGRYAEAHDLLAPVYRGFAEGLDTADLKAAQGLLERIQMAAASHDALVVTR